MARTAVKTQTAAGSDSALAVSPALVTASGALFPGPVPVRAVPVGAVPVRAVGLPVPVRPVPVGAVPVGAVPVRPVPVGAVPVGAVPGQLAPGSGRVDDRVPQEELERERAADDGAGGVVGDDLHAAAAQVEAAETVRAGHALVGEAGRSAEGVIGVGHTGTHGHRV